LTFDIPVLVSKIFLFLKGEQNKDLLWLSSNTNFWPESVLFFNGQSILSTFTALLPFLYLLPCHVKLSGIQLPTVFKMRTASGRSRDVLDRV
jgi:hypothetical protein